MVIVLLPSIEISRLEDFLFQMQLYKFETQITIFGEEPEEIANQ